jgi:hypothetical protein
VGPPVQPPVGPPVDPPVGPPVQPPVGPPVDPPVGPPVQPPVGPPDDERPDPTLQWSVSAHTVGTSDARGTMANAVALKDTGQNSASVTERTDGFFAVDHAGQGRDDPDTIGGIEALLFTLPETVSFAQFLIQGETAGASYHLYDANGVRIGSARDLSSSVDDGVLEISEEFAFIAFQGGTTGAGRSGVESSFSVKPVAADNVTQELNASGIEPLTDLIEGDAGAVPLSTLIEQSDESGDWVYQLEHVIAEFRESGSLNLVDLLHGETEETIDSFIYAEQVGSDTVIHLHTQGHLNPDLGNYETSIVLEGVNMAGMSSSDFVIQMLNDGKLVIDQ